MQGILEHNLTAEAIRNATDEVFGKRIGLMTSLFGCWHKALSRPFTNKRVSYIACLDCGARKKFDPANFKTSDEFYYPPVVAHDNAGGN